MQVAVVLSKIAYDEKYYLWQYLLLAKCLTLLNFLSPHVLIIRRVTSWMIFPVCLGGQPGGGFQGFAESCNIYHIIFNPRLWLVSVI